MAEPPFVYQAPFPLGPDETEYECIGIEGVSSAEFEGRPILKVEPAALTRLAAEAIKAINFTLRPAHLAQVAAILDDPEASENDRMVALMLLRNAEIASHGILPFCQDTGTATIFGKKGQQVWTGVDDAEHLSKGIYETYIRENLRYSQTAPLTMYDEVNTRTNLPAQIDLLACQGDEYHFLFVSKGGGSANKSFLFQETKALLNPARLREFCFEKMRAIGTSACPPYHLVFVIGGTSAEHCLKTVKLASTRYLDTLPDSGNEHGRAFRDRALEQDLLALAREVGIGAQFGGKYFALDVRVIRLPRHGASCPV
ncbi:MAG: fumarate hydratase, partial [Verrucomicrobia bacterium]|nr:fumarate hydratase [Verrucomicrobiota bacterium]